MNRYLFLSVFWGGFFGSLLATLGFGVLFNVRGKQLAAAGFTGGLAGFVYRYCLYFGMSDPLANFTAAIALSITAEIFARKMCTTVSTFTACALIPLVPGGTAYEMMVEFSSGRALNGVLKMLDVASISGMLALGILLVSTLTRLFFYSRRKLTQTRQKIAQSRVAMRMERRMEQIGMLAGKESAVKPGRRKKRRRPSETGNASLFKPDSS